MEPSRWSHGLGSAKIRLGNMRSESASGRGTHDSVEDPRNRDVLVYVNGRLVPRGEAAVSVFDSGFLIGDGIWEGLRLHEGVFLFLEEHLDRLFQGIRAVGLRIDLSRDDLRDALERTVRANRMESGVHVRLMITRGIKKTPSQDPRLIVGGPTVVIVAEYKQANPETAKRGIRLFTSSVRRGSPDYLDPRLNCHSKIHEVIALIQALEAGADEALMLDVHGFVSTCNATNFFIVRRGEVWTSTGQYCMNGITRGKILQLCRAHGMVALEKNFSLVDVYDADEAFVTGTFGGLTPVVAVDGKKIGSADSFPVVARLKELYQREISDYVSSFRTAEKTRETPR
jgi:branched-chain amino acid aminotransferase